jgi:hypothetical protein
MQKHVSHKQRNSKYSSFDRMRNPPPHSLPRSVTLQRKNGDSGAESVLCTAVWEAWISYFCSARPSSDNFRMIPHLPRALGVGISSFRKRAGFVKGKMYDVRVFQKKTWNEWDSLFFAVGRNLCAMRVVNWRCQLWLRGGCCERDWKWSPIIFT